MIKFYTDRAFGIFLVTLLSCSGDEVGSRKPDMPEEFKPYFESFLNEAAKRNTNVNVDDLTIRLVPYAELNNYCGYSEPNPPRVRIADTDNCWHQQTEINKEILLFHEFGHSLLQRSHLNVLMPNGDYKSMMFGGNQFDLYTKFTSERRDYYLDELFAETTQPPSWANVKTTPVQILSDSITEDSDWEYYNNAKNSALAFQEGEITNTEFSSASYALSIHSPAPSDGFSYWVYSLTPDEISVSSALTLKVKVKRSLTGPGVYIALRCDASSEVATFKTSQNNTEITGTIDFYVDYEVKITYFPEQVTAIRIFLIMDGATTGTAYFDDIRLVNYN